MPPNSGINLWSNFVPAIFFLGKVVEIAFAETKLSTVANDLGLRSIYYQVAGTCGTVVVVAAQLEYN